MLPRGLELNQLAKSCVTSPRNMQCIASVATPLTMLQKLIQVLQGCMPN